MADKKNISLEEKLRKLAEDKKKTEVKREEKKPETPAKSEDKEPVKEKLPEDKLPAFESVITPLTLLTQTEEDEETPKTQNLEKAVSEVQTDALPTKKENEPRAYTISGDQDHIGKYSSGDTGSESKYHTVKLTERNLGRDRTQPLASNLMSGKLVNPFDHSDRNNYMNPYSAENNNDVQDSARMYEETKERFYETSQRDIHKRPNKNI